MQKISDWLSVHKKLTLAIILIITGAYSIGIFYYKNNNETLSATSIYQQGRYEEALELFLKAKELEPNLPLAHHNLGNVYDELKQYDKSIESYTHTLSLRDDAKYYNYAETYNNLATVYQKLDQLDKALENYQAAAEYDPTYFRAYSNLGVINLIQKDYDLAEKNFKKALEINPGFGPAEHGLAISLASLGNPEEAIPHYQKSIQLSPRIIDNYNHLASIYDELDQADKTIEVLQLGAINNPENLNLKINLAIVLGNNNKFQEAKIQLEDVLKINPNNQEVLQLLEQINAAM